MKLSEYIKKLKDLEALHKDTEVIYSVDEEGNEFKPVYFDPSIIDGKVCVN
jgi:hypothetical protein